MYMYKYTHTRTHISRLLHVLLPPQQLALSATSAYTTVMTYADVR
jgi:hypothetical protein